MTQISRKDGRSSVGDRRWRDRIVHAIKWWSEHQAWPATEDIRIEWRQPNRP